MRELGIPAGGKSFRSAVTFYPANGERVLEKALAGELTHHLGYAKGQERAEGAEFSGEDTPPSRRWGHYTHCKLRGAFILIVISSTKGINLTKLPSELAVMLVVTFAVPHESRIFRQTEASRSVRLLHTGIGQAAAAGALRRVFAGQLPHAVISSGFAGALDPQLRIGDLIADSSHSHPGVLSLLPSIIHCAPVHTAEHSVDSIAAKAELRRTTGASAVDMESSAVAAECIRAGVPLLILRAISDSATDPIPVPLPVAWNPETQRPRPLRLLAWLATHPARILPFARFLRGTNIAAHQLGQSLPDIVTTVAQGKFDRTAW